MQRKPGFPATNCSIKMPDNTMPSSETLNSIHNDEDIDQKKRLQLINFGHCQWGFNNWSWAVTKQDVDFVDFSNGKYTVGIAAFVSVKLKSFDIHRENVGYATTSAPSKGSAIYKGRKETNPPEKEKTESNSEEEQRAERRRRQKQAQEEFRLKQLKRQNPENNGPEKLDLHRSSIDKELLDIATQDIIIEDTGNITEEPTSGPSGSKRHSPDLRASKRRPSLMNKLDIAKE